MRFKFLVPFLFQVLCAYGQTQPPDSKSSESSNERDDPFRPKTTIVVTATRGQEELEKSPASISVVTRKEMEARDSQTVDESINTVEGIYVRRTKGPADTITRVVARGFNGANRTLVLLDGQPLNERMPVSS